MVFGLFLIFQERNHQEVSAENKDFRKTINPFALILLT